LTKSYFDVLASDLEEVYGNRFLTLPLTAFLVGNNFALVFELQIPLI